MKPGVTTRPVASMTHSAVPSPVPTAAILPSSTATSPTASIALAGSTTRPPLIIKLSMSSLRVPETHRFPCYSAGAIPS